MKKYVRNKTNYIGLACSFHEPAISIVNSEGEIVFAEASERYAQMKRGIQLRPDELFRVPSLIKKYCEPETNLILAKTCSRKAPFYLRLLEISMFLRTHLFRKGDTQNAHLKMLLHSTSSSVRNAGDNIFSQVFRNDDPSRVVQVRWFEHHLTHAAAACFGSPFEEALCAVIDGMGEWRSVTFYRYVDGRLTRISNDVKSRFKIPRPLLIGSLGLFYETLCGACGFDPMKGEEWKVMGLAAYGKFNREIYETVRPLIEVSGSQDLRFTRMDWEQVLLKLGRSEETDIKDLSHTGQVIFMEIMDELLNNLYKMGESDNLVLSGGCFLNSSYNGQILERTPFKNLYVNSAPGDDGIATGAALLAYYSDHPDRKAKPTFTSPYLGSEVDYQRFNFLEKCARIPHLEKIAGKTHQYGAKLIAEAKIIGWVQGRAEFGPRALGNRSILADPRCPEMKDKINSLVKFREEFRPFAPSILHEFGEQYFENYQESPYMERTLRFREEVKAQVPAVVHVDGTGRVQTVKKEWNEKYHDLIKEFHRLTGVPLILNTSFNIMGKPIVHSIEDALAMFYTTGLDALIIGDFLITKNHAA